jgi:hypothetical protein
LTCHDCNNDESHNLKPNKDFFYIHETVCNTSMLRQFNTVVNGRY